MSQLCAYSIGIEENNLSMWISYIKYAKNKHTDCLYILSTQLSVNERTLDFLNLLRYFRYIWQSFHILFFIYSMALVCFSNLSTIIFWYGLIMNHLLAKYNFLRRTNETSVKYSIWNLQLKLLTLLAWIKSLLELFRFPSCKLSVQHCFSTL